MANNGLEALQKIRKVSTVGSDPAGQAFDCVIMDLEMPVMDGLTAVQHIRAEEAAGTLTKNQVIALSKFPLATIDPKFRRKLIPSLSSWERQTGPN